MKKRNLKSTRDKRYITCGRKNNMTTDMSLGKMQVRREDSNIFKILKEIHY